MLCVSSVKSELSRVVHERSPVMFTPPIVVLGCTPTLVVVVSIVHHASTFSNTELVGCQSFISPALKYWIYSVSYPPPPPTMFLCVIFICQLSFWGGIDSKYFIISLWLFIILIIVNDYA